MVTYPVTIREAKSGDVDKLYEMGIAEEYFSVSAETRFYKKSYLRNWIEKPDGDILLVAEFNREIVGFLLCRIVRNSVAILDNIMVSASKRGQGIGISLLKECIKRIQSKSINYIAGIIREENNNIKFFLKRGFVLGNKFNWIEGRLEDLKLD